MNKNVFVFTALVLSAGVVFAESETEERETFGKWRIGVGAAFNCGVKSSLGARNLTMPSMYSVPVYSTKGAAELRAANREYDGGGYIKPDSTASDWSTTNWKLPESSYLGDGRFALNNSYEEVIGSSFWRSHYDNSGDNMQYGISVELSRELWIHDEKDEHRWGVDFAAAFSYFFRRDLYSAHGTVSRVDTVKDGVIRTDVDDPDATDKYDAVPPNDWPVDGMYGHGAETFTSFAPALGLQGLNFRGNEYLSSPYDLAGVPNHTVSSSYAYNANGDYRELEMLFMVRPWYEITDWWRVFAQIGLGVSWGKFESSFSTSSGYSCSEDFAQWDCYGVAGLGTAFRYKRFDISIDVLGRFLRDDFAVDGRNLKGTIDRANWGFRVMLGYSF